MGSSSSVEDRREWIPPFNDGGCGAPDDDGVEHNDHSRGRPSGRGDGGRRRR